jgi:hypothetical protein
MEIRFTYLGLFYISVKMLNLVRSEVLLGDGQIIGSVEDADPYEEVTWCRIRWKTFMDWEYIRI